MKIGIYYFSATGNTKYGILILKKHLEKLGHICDVFSIEEVNKINEKKYDLIGFGSPVFGGFAAEILTDFIKKLPNYKKQILAFSILCPCVDQPLLRGFWGSREHIRDLLETKNIKIIDELGFIGEASHPIFKYLCVKANFTFLLKQSKGRPNKTDEKKIQEFAGQLQKTFDDYKKGIKKKLHTNLLLKWYSYKVKLSEKIYNKLFPITVNKEKCTKCGFCAKNCPEKAIKLNPFPIIDLKKCFHCQKCVNLCPSGALYIKGIKTKQYKGAFERINKLRY